MIFLMIFSMIILLENNAKHVYLQRIGLSERRFVSRRFEMTGDIRKEEFLLEFCLSICLLLEQWSNIGLIMNNQMECSSLKTSFHCDVFLLWKKIITVDQMIKNNITKELCGLKFNSTTGYHKKKTIPSDILMNRWNRKKIVRTKDLFSFYSFSREYLCVCWINDDSCEQSIVLTKIQFKIFSFFYSNNRS